MEAILGKSDTDDISAIKFQRSEVDRTDDEIATMRKYIDVEDEPAERPRESFVRTAATAPPSPNRITFVKIGVSVAVITVAFGVFTFFPQMFQVTATPHLNNALMIAALAAVVTVVLGIGFWLV